MSVDINVTVNNSTMTFPQTFPAPDSLGTYSYKFTFSSEWDSYTKYIYFEYSNGIGYTRYLPIPFGKGEFVLSTNVKMIAIFGVNGSLVKSTDYVKIEPVSAASAEIQHIITTKQKIDVSLLDSSDAAVIYNKLTNAGVFDNHLIVNEG